jgi:cytochrome c556
MKTFLIATMAFAIGATAVLAQSDPIATRKATMKKVGEASAAVGKIAKGETPFNLATVQGALKEYQSAAKIMPTLFPDTSKTGGDTAALPHIWEAKADFEAKWVKFGKDAADAEAKITDEATFKTAYPDVTKNCGGCHELNRAKKS